MNRADAAEQIVADLRELAALTSDEGGANASWTPVWQQRRNGFAAIWKRPEPKCQDAVGIYGRSLPVKVKRPSS